MDPRGMKAFPPGQYYFTHFDADSMFSFVHNLGHTAAVAE